MSTVFSVIQGDAHFSSARNMIFNNLKSLIDDNVVDVKPDFYDEASSAQIDRRIRAELGSYITSSTQQQASALLNFFTEVKSSDESEAVTKRQACYDGVVGARDMRKLATFEMKNSETIYDNNAYTITSTYHSVIGTLQMYTIHSTKSIKSIKPIKSIKSIDSESSLEYNMTQLEGWALTEFRETFLQGTGVFRNARDLAKAQRDGFIATANGRVIGMLRETFTLESSDHSILSQSTNEPTALESETSADELAQDRSEGPSLSHRRLKRGSVKSNLQRDSNKRLKRTTRKQDSDGWCVWANHWTVQDYLPPKLPAKLLIKPHLIWCRRQNGTCLGIRRPCSTVRSNAAAAAAAAAETATLMSKAFAQEAFGQKASAPEVLCSTTPARTSSS